MVFHKTGKLQLALMSLSVLAIVLVPLFKNGPLKKVQARVIDFLDPHTILVQMENQQETLKLLGIDSPEVKRHEKKKKQAQKHGIPLEDIAKKGEIALSQCKKLLLPGTSIALEYNTRDSQNRILAIVYLPNGKMLNTYLLEQGLVFANLSFGIAYKEELEMAHQRARNNKVGIWDKHEAN